MPGSGVSSPAGWIEALPRELETERHARLLQRERATDAGLSVFKTDGCSGGLSAGWQFLARALPVLRARHGERPPWEACCVAHDRLYHRGVPPAATADASYRARLQADRALAACVEAVGARRAPALAAAYGLSRVQITALYAAVSDLMFRAVRIGGIPCSELPWRWGYGWPECD
jgi:hypothetical protein